MKTFQMRMKIKLRTIENQRVPDLSKKRHRKENNPNADEKKIKTIENQRVFKLSKKRHKSDNVPNAVETETENQRSISDFTFIQNFDSNFIYFFINEVLFFFINNCYCFPIFQER